ncbi:MAG: cytoplasmic protein [Clostridiales bacterium]|jgi:uncharacterized membrane protein|nr:cytoplasmic protein [Clostridiales bacterium]
MGKTLRTLLIGESWMIHTVEAKGYDVFTFDSYGVGTEYIEKVLSTDGFSFHHMPSHRIGLDFPHSAEGLKQYDAIIISDVGANTFLLPMETFVECKRSPNKLQILKDYVLQGGGLCMAGGYLTFMGMEGKGKYYGSILETVLPVDFLPHDDRQEHPEGIDVEVQGSQHPLLKGITGPLSLLGYNRARLKEGCQTLVAYENDPLLAVGQFGQGRSVAWASDLAPHWASAEFCTSPSYTSLWHNIVRWLAKEI